MKKIHEIELNEIISQLPDPILINDGTFSGQQDTLFLCSLGFEDRCLNIPKKLAKIKKYHCDQAIYFEYSTNKEDSRHNLDPLTKYLTKFSRLQIPLECDSENFFEIFRNFIAGICLPKIRPKILFDISTCSSKLLLTSLKVLFEFDIELKIVYSEALVYHPKQDEIDTDEKMNKWTSDDEFGLAKGIADFTSSRGFPGNNIDGLPNAIIVFASFKPERNENAILKADEILLSNPGKRVIWIIGKPRLEKDQYRVNFLIRSNHISSSSNKHLISTFDYKDTLLVLNKIYKEYNLEYHLIISPLGSKLQGLGISLFHFVKPDITINFSQPKEYNANRYSEGAGECWMLNFGDLIRIKYLLNCVGYWELSEYFEYLKNIPGKK